LPPSQECNAYERAIKFRRKKLFHLAMRPRDSVAPLLRKLSIRAENS